MKACQALLIIALVVMIAASSACQVEDPADLVSEKARQWTTDYSNVEHVVAPKMANLAFKSIPRLSNTYHPIIEEQITQRVKWSYSTPQQEPKARYSIIMTAQATINLPVSGIEKTYVVSVDWFMLYDIPARLTVALYMDENTFKLTEL